MNIGGRTGTFLAPELLFSHLCHTHSDLWNTPLKRLYIFYQFPPSLPFIFFFLHQLCCSAIRGNWCVKVRLFVSHFRIAVTTLPTVCLFTLMSPAAMVTCFYLPSPFEPSAIKHSPFLWFPRPWSSKRHTGFRGTLTLCLSIVWFPSVLFTPDQVRFVLSLLWLQ